MKLRIRSSTGVSSIDITPDTTFAALKASIPCHSIRTGFPPKLITATDHQPVSSFLSHGDTLIIPTDSAPPITTAKPSTAAAQSSLVSQGTLNIRVVPDDNSCLFRSVNALLGNASTITSLRRIVAQAVSDNPHNYSEAILGRSPASYRAWITSQNAWGGAIELSILSRHFRLQLAAFDVKTMRLDRYGEDGHYSTVAYLVYDGIHYNYIALALGASKSADTDVTQFPASDTFAMTQVRALIQKEHDAHKFTDTASFLLKCGQCGTRLKGETQALEHAKQTGHSQFTEN